MKEYGQFDVPGIKQVECEFLCQKCGGKVIWGQKAQRSFIMERKSIVLLIALLVVGLSAVTAQNVSQDEPERRAEGAWDNASSAPEKPWILRDGENMVINGVTMSFSGSSFTMENNSGIPLRVIYKHFRDIGRRDRRGRPLMVQPLEDIIEELAVRTSRTITFSNSPTYIEIKEVAPQ